MASAIDPTKPEDGVPAEKADLRANLQAAADEITALQEPAWTNAAGDQSAAPSGQARKLTGNVTGVPIANGWFAKYHAEGGARTVTPASGNCILPDGTSQATATIASGTRAVVHGDGTNLLVDGRSVT